MHHSVCISDVQVHTQLNQKSGAERGRNWDGGEGGGGGTELKWGGRGKGGAGQYHINRI